MPVWAEHWHRLLCWYGTVHARGRAGLDELACIALTVIENVTVTQCRTLTRTTFCVRWNGQGGAIFARSSASIDIQHSSFVGNSAVCLHLTFGCLSCALRQSHVAKGPEIEACHRLVPAVGIMRLVAGQAWLLRQWSFACIGVTNVCLCV